VAFKDVSLANLYLGWSIGFTLIFSTIAIARAPNSLRGIIEHVIAAGGLALVVAAWFAVPMWLVIQVAR
jgi:hypothetical protein